MDNSKAQEVLLLDWRNCLAVERFDDRVSGEWVFRGTRLPVKALFENLEDGASVDDFVEWFPGVGREQILDLKERGDGSFEMFAATPSGRRIQVIWRYDREDSDDVPDIFGEVEDAPIFVITAY